MIRHNVVLFLVVLLISNSYASKANDDIDTIRQRVLQIGIWPTVENISETVQTALSYSATLNSSCYWPDIDYADQSLELWSTVAHMYRLTTMLQAITVNESTIKNDPKIFAQVHCALNVWLIHDWQNPNWYANQIRVPLQATSQLLMLAENATAFETQKIQEMSFRAAWWLRRSTDVGANLLWMIQIEIYRSLATNNRTGLDQGFPRMWKDVNISSTSDVGIQTDWSYHFHGGQLLTGTYGVVWINNVLLFLLCSEQTQYQPDDQVMSLAADFLINGAAWMIMSNYWDWNIAGRSICKLDNGFPHSLAIIWIRMIAERVKTDERKIELIHFADRLDNQPNATLLIGNRHFYLSDYQVHRRPNWIFTIKMQSTRTQPVECLNGDNLKDEHGGQGVLNLYRIGMNDYTAIFPLLDWQAINGITVEHDIPLEPCVHGAFDWKNLPFVGGVSDGQYGLAMMDTASHNLTAQRSWHFFDEAVIALATNLTLTTPTTAWTTLASRLLPTGQITVGFFNSTTITLNDGNYSFPYAENKSFNVQWVHLEDSNIAYILQLQQQYQLICIEVGMKTGNYNTIGPANATVTARMTTLYINHGRGPYTLDYNYMIVPNVSLASIPTLIRTYDEEQVFTCTSTNKYFHGTMWPKLKRASFVLWKNITTTFSCQSPMFQINIELSDAGAYLYSETDSTFTFTASHPIHTHGTLNVSVDRIGHGEGCMVLSNVEGTRTNVTLTLPSSHDHLGASVNVTCRK